MVKTEFSEVISDMLRSNFPEIDNKRIESALEDILNMTGRVDYRLKYETLTWEHCSCLEELKKLKEDK